jgi:hypothetical protein
MPLYPPHNEVGRRFMGPINTVEDAVNAGEAFVKGYYQFLR